MLNPSNLYAEKIFSEHPTVLWGLDDQADYISLVSESERDIEASWSVSGGTPYVGVGITNEPFPDSVVTVIDADVPVSIDTELECVSADIVNFLSLNQSMGTFAVGSYFYSNSPFLKSVSIGYQYTDTTTSQIVEELQTFTAAVFQAWSFISGTFEIPDENTNLRLVIKAIFEPGGTSSDYQILFNGISLGQWSEEFNAVSLGVEPVSIPSDIPVDSTQGIEADAYGLLEEFGYYLVNDNSLVARNTSVPMVYGGTGVTKILPNANSEPSLIIPGKGFLNKSGQFLDYTVEFWARINSNAVEPRKIFGPLTSNDGLYVDGGFLTLVINKSFASHFVGEWFRPMLIQIRLIRNSASVVLNGEEVIALTLDTDSLDLPDEYNGLMNQDWLGFYAYKDVSPIEVDCIAIYPYSVPVTVAKRRWVYGQGVISPESINSAYGGISAFVDYSFADYTSNYNYPNFAKWEQGSFDNLSTTSIALTTPTYSLPQISLQSKTTQDLYNDNQDIQVLGEDLFITLRPNSSWDDVNAYFVFDRLDFLANQVAAIYGVFSSSQSTSEEILIKISDSLSSNHFVIKKDMDEIKYLLSFNGTEQEIFSTPFVEDEKFAVGINIPELSDTFGSQVSSFFGNRRNLSVYIAGDNTAQYQFDGKIYSIGLCTQYNLSTISTLFDENGFAIPNEVVSGSGPTYGEQFLSHTASYTLIPLQEYGTYFLDIGASGYWEDYLPLSYFAQFVKNDAGNEFYDLDFLQFNVGYPAPSKLLEVETTSEWNYGELASEFGNPVQRTYQQLDNNLFTNWNDYGDMEQRAIKFYEYDTSDAFVRSYITLQYVEDGANAPQDFFTSTEPAQESGVIDVESHTHWPTTRFEVVDNSIIYPATPVDFNELAIVYRLEFNVKGIISRPISIRRLELASQALNDNSFNPVGTRFGIDVFPYRRDGVYYDYKAKNPFTIYKGSTPYLYLNRSSGLQIRGEYDPLISRGLGIPVNRTQADNFRMSAMQAWMRFDEDRFPGTSTELMEIVYRGDTIKFFFIADNPQATRARIFAVSGNTGAPVNGISYYVNGVAVREPVITVQEWSVIGVSFASALNYDLFIGAINLNGPLVFNNVAFYQANNLQQVQSTLVRPWLRVLNDGTTELDWQYWDTNFNWEGVLVIGSSDLYGVNPSDVYKTYIGTNKIIVDDDSGMSFDPDSFSIYSDIVWQESIVQPV